MRKDSSATDKKKAQDKLWRTTVSELEILKYLRVTDA